MECYREASKNDEYLLLLVLNLSLFQNWQNAFNGFKMIKRKELKSRRDAKMRELEKYLGQNSSYNEMRMKEVG